METVKVAVVSLNQTPLDWRGNSERIVEVIKAARQQQVSFLGLPEMCLSGYGCEDAFLTPDTAESAFQFLLNLLPHTQGIFLSVGLPLRYKGALFNTVAVICDEKLVGLVPKKFLAGDGVHYEPRWFKDWPSGYSDTYSYSDSSQNQNTVPIGDLFFQWNNIRIGFEICEEAWVAQRPGALLAQKSVDIIFNPSASPFSFGKNEIRKRFVLEGSRAFSCVYAYANLLGNESGRLIFDGSLFIANHGELINEGLRFSYKDFQIISSIVDLNSLRARRNQSANFNPVIAQPVASTTENPTEIALPLNKFKLPLTSSLASLPIPAQLPISKQEEFMRATCLGLFDYLRKSYSQGFTISLSGGTDSAVVAVLAASCFKLAHQELGEKSFKEKLSYLKALVPQDTLPTLLPKLIHTVYQSTQNSTPQTYQAAQAVSQALGVSFSEWSVNDLKNQYEMLISKVLGRPLTWNEDDLALQNIQARVRAPGVWLLSNVKGFLLLATSNRSEAAVGYATMDGDTAGGLSPIAGVDKAFLSQWIQWMGEDSQALLGPIPELKLIYSIPPTAELRPPQQHQTDETDLMPYPVLDFIERHLLIDRLKPIDLFQVLTQEFKQYKSSQLRDWLVRFLKLWTQNQWKRERYAPSFHLDTESLDPKTWCRFPILSKAFSLDIEELNKLTL